MFGSLHLKLHFLKMLVLFNINVNKKFCLTFQSYNYLRIYMILKLYHNIYNINQEQTYCLFYNFSYRTNYLSYKNQKLISVDYHAIKL